MRNIGMFIMPTVSENNVQHKIQYLLNSTNIIPQEDETKISGVLSGVHWFAEWKLVHAILLIGVIPPLCGEIAHIWTVLTQSKHSVSHCLEGLLPVVLSVLYMTSAHIFSVVAWEKPIYVFMSLTFFFSLNASRMIIATVTKKRFSIFNDFHLTIPIILGILAFPINAMGLDIQEEILCSVLILLTGFTYFWYIVNVIKQITSYLDIYCLTIKGKVE